MEFFVKQERMFCEFLPAEEDSATSFILEEHRYAYVLEYTLFSLAYRSQVASTYAREMNIHNQLETIFWKPSGIFSRLYLTYI